MSSANFHATIYIADRNQVTSPGRTGYFAECFIKLLIVWYNIWQETPVTCGRSQVQEADGAVQLLFWGGWRGGGGRNGGATRLLWSGAGGCGGADACWSPLARVFTSGLQLP